MYIILSVDVCRWCRLCGVVCALYMNMILHMCIYTYVCIYVCMYVYDKGRTYCMYVCVYVCHRHRQYPYLLIAPQQAPLHHHCLWQAFLLPTPAVCHSPFQAFPPSQLQFKQVAMATTMAQEEGIGMLSMGPETNAHPIGEWWGALSLYTKQLHYLCNNV